MFGWLRSVRDALQFSYEVYAKCVTAIEWEQTRFGKLIMKHVVLAVVFTISMAACSPKAVNSSDAPTDGALNAVVDYSATGWMAKTLPEIVTALEAEDVTSEALVHGYLDRIAMIDQAGPTLQAVLALNPNALEEARASDAARKAGQPMGPLAGVPVLLKDNIESKDQIATTAGALALKGNVTGRDSPLVAGLRGSGAIILGKTNLSQWANFRSENSMSGWSALGGQVRNPRMLDRNPCGSSSGSAAATAASLAAASVGTETNGSIICPSTVNGIVGFKPTVGLVSQQYIVPISSSQDTAGPMTKTVTGAALMLNAMSTGDAKTDYVAGLDVGALSGKRIGVMRFAQGSNTKVKALFDRALTDLQEAGAELVEIDGFVLSTNDYQSKSYDLLKYEFKATLNAYLAEAAPAVTVRSLKELIAFNAAHADVELALFDQGILEASEMLGDLSTPAYLAAKADVQAATGVNGIDKMMADNSVDILVSPSGPLAPRVDAINGDVWPDWAGAGYLAAVSGYPNLTVPMGEVKGLPVGLSLMAGKDQDANVLAMGYAYEQQSKKRVDPQYLSNAEARPEIAEAMKRRAD